jgi:hypothetical protein
MKALGHLAHRCFVPCASRITAGMERTTGMDLGRPEAGLIYLTANRTP